MNYTYDPVGNRTQLSSTLAPVPAGLWSYNANDQLTSDTYDANGNTTASGGLGYVHDFENHLVQQGGLSIVYDGDGNRVSKTVAGVTTTDLVSGGRVARSYGRSRFACPSRFLRVGVLTFSGIRYESIRRPEP